MVLKSINHATEIFGDKTTTPKLNFKLNFVGSKCVSTPDVNEICEKYGLILDLVSVKKLLFYVIHFLQNHILMVQKYSE